MKRGAVIKKIKQAAKQHGVAWVLDHEGANHSVYRLGGQIIPIPRHSEIDDRFATEIYKECETELGRRWWR